MGILLFALLSASVPFKAKTIPELHKIILRGKYEFPEYFSSNVKNLISEMLNPIPTLRIKLGNIKKHSWFNEESSEQTCHSKDTKYSSNRHHSIISAVKEYGFTREFVENSLKSREINHGTASYNILDINMFE